MEALERDRGGTGTHSYTGDCTSCQRLKVRRMRIFFEKINKFRICHFKRKVKNCLGSVQFFSLGICNC